MAPSPSRHQPLVVTILANYARERGGALPVSALVTLLGDLGVDAPAARSTISRMKKRGTLDAVRVGTPAGAQAAGYQLDPSLDEVIRAGDRLIFEPPGGSLEQPWVLAVFSVPESDRPVRHLIRSSLGRLGFGNVAPGVLIAPAAKEEEARRSLARSGALAHVQLFRTEPLGPDRLHEHRDAWWDLTRIADLYAAFTARHAAAEQRWCTGELDDRGAFAAYVPMLTEWRRLPYLDPGLPPELLPAGWPGHEAHATFTRLREALAEPAARHVDTVAPRA